MEYAEDDIWDAGYMGCGELLLVLRKRLLRMPGGTLKLIANDTGAIEDIPAYCRMTGHKLRHATHPEYWIQARTNTS